MKPLRTVRIFWNDGTETVSEVAPSEFPSFVAGLDFDRIDKLDASPVQ